jgi:hypothetical protein
MKPRLKRITVRRIQENSEKIALVQKAKDEKQLAKENRERERIKKELKKKGIFFVHNTGLKKLRELQKMAKSGQKKSKKQKTNK